MSTRLYSDLFGLIQAMLGISVSIVEAGRVKALINRRIQKAYRASNYWTRHLKVGEARTVSSGVIGYTQASLSDIDTFLRIHKTSGFTGSGSPMTPVEETKTSVGSHRSSPAVVVAVVSTSKGLLTDREARRQRIGGEVLCYVW